MPDHRALCSNMSLISTNICKQRWEEMQEWGDNAADQSDQSVDLQEDAGVTSH